MHNSFPLIDKYFENTLTKKELDLFNDLLASDKDFLEEFNFQKDVQTSFKSYKKKELKSRLQAIDSKSNKETRVIPLINKKWLAVASVALLISFLGYYTFSLYSNTTSLDNLYAENFTPIENIVFPLDRNENEESLKADAFFAYEKADYKKAEKLFNALYKTENNEEALLYRANCLLALKRFDEAIESLETFVKLDNKLKTKSYWYLGLAYLKTNNKTKAKTYFQKLLDSGNSFKTNEAKRIIKNIN